MWWNKSRNTLQYNQKQWSKCSQLLLMSTIQIPKNGSPHKCYALAWRSKNTNWILIKIDWLCLGNLWKPEWTWVISAITMPGLTWQILELTSGFLRDISRQKDLLLLKQKEFITIQMMWVKKLKMIILRKLINLMVIILGIILCIFLRSFNHFI